MTTLSFLAAFTLFASSIQYLLGESVILSRPRNKLPLALRYLLACPACAGTWLGLLSALHPAGWQGWGDLVAAHARYLLWVPVPLLGALGGMGLVPMGRGLMALGWSAAALPMAPTVPESPSEAPGDGHEGHDHHPGDGHDHDHEVAA